MRPQWPNTTTSNVAARELDDPRITLLTLVHNQLGPHLPTCTRSVCLPRTVAAAGMVPAMGDKSEHVDRIEGEPATSPSPSDTDAAARQAALLTCVHAAVRAFAPD